MYVYAEPTIMIDAVHSLNSLNKTERMTLIGVPVPVIYVFLNI